MYANKALENNLLKIIWSYINFFRWDKLYDIKFKLAKYIGFVEDYNK